MTEAVRKRLEQKLDKAKKLYANLCEYVTQTKNADPIWYEACSDVSREMRELTQKLGR